MKTYCLGYTHERCSTCQHEKNWQMLNQMQDALRKLMQSQMQRVDDAPSAMPFGSFGQATAAPLRGCCFSGLTFACSQGHSAK